MESGKEESVSMTEQSGEEDKNHYIQELLSERQLVDESCRHAIRLLDQEICKVEEDAGQGSAGGDMPALGPDGLPHGIGITHDKKGRITYHVQAISDKPVRIQSKLQLPVQQYPKFNFVGRLLGPKGQTLKRLQEETQTRMSILGRGSMRNKQTEDELRAANDPKNAHLNEDLHVMVDILAPLPSAFVRLNHAITELRKFLTPESEMNEMVKQEQLATLAFLNGGGEMPPSVGMGGRGRGGSRGVTLLPSPPTHPGGHPGMLQSRGPPGMVQRGVGMRGGGPGIRGRASTRGGMAPRDTRPGAPPPSSRVASQYAAAPPQQPEEPYPYVEERYRDNGAGVTAGDVAMEEVYGYDDGTGQGGVYDYGHGGGGGGSGQPHVGSGQERSGAALAGVYSSYQGSASGGSHQQQLYSGGGGGGSASADIMGNKLSNPMAGKMPSAPPRFHPYPSSGGGGGGVGGGGGRGRSF